LAEPAVEGAPASDLKFTGSTLIVLDDSREGVIEQLKADIYTKSGVWDVEKVSQPQAIRIRRQGAEGRQCGSKLMKYRVGSDLAYQDGIPRSMRCKAGMMGIV
jgi:hypothetical protein